MKNEKKAKEIARECVYCFADAENGALKMAEHKDDYFKKVLEDKLSFFEEEYKKSHSEYMSGVCDGIRSIWNILFNNNEEK